LVSFLIINTQGANIETRRAANSEQAKYLQKYPRGSINKIFAKEYKAECNFYDVETINARTVISNSCINLDGEKTVLLWGDSHTQALSYGLRSVLGKEVAFSQIATSSCKPKINNPEQANVTLLA
jgi:hypothetical protein